ncbi:hypothetical protein IBTHAUMO2_930004 [Nitrosopumilaceae archaeon]|nr:hypothetical protein IBTHAUMO2_930004 [Nitrosopumilaceae archaeon]
MGATFWIMVVLSIIAVAGSGGWALLLVVPYFFFVWRDAYRKDLLKRASEDDLEDPINGAVLGDMSYEDHAANEEFQKKLDKWR